MADVAKTFHACFNAFPMRGDDGRGTFRAPKTGPVRKLGTVYGFLAPGPNKRTFDLVFLQVEKAPIRVRGEKSVQSPQFLQCLTPYQQVRLRERLHFMQRARVNARAPPISAISEKHYGR